MQGAVVSLTMRLTLFLAASLTAAGTVGAQTAVDAWPPHSRQRPTPPVVTPTTFVATPPPPDAIVLFDGTSLGSWHSNNRAARWRVADGAFEVVPGTGEIGTRQSFGDVQLHIEWMSPSPPRGADQDRGNSGVFFMGRYEVQILDSWQNTTYADGQASALYGQYPPMVNASRPPGEWQSYDIIFRRPRFDASGKFVSPARVTVLHNGVLVHDNAALVGPTGHTRRPPYEAHPDRLPITLQDHGHPVRFRNVWVRDIEGK